VDVDADKELIGRCLQNDSLAQKELYNRYAPRMYGICLRYAGHTLEAQDILQEGFIRVFLQLKQFRFQGSFESWLRRIFINTAITLANRERRFSYKEELPSNFKDDNDGLEGLSRLNTQEILGLIQELPAGYRMVFNLFEVEGYTHKEIGRKLRISENTSKSQLFNAKRRLREKLTEYGNDYGRERS